jgi:polar amino acid transport system substrate-binding protein
VSYRSVLIVSISLVVSSVGGANAASLKVAFNSDWPPYSTGAAGTVSGILPDLIEEIVSTKMGVKVEAVGYPWARVQHLVKVGQVDAFVTVPTKTRLTYALSSKESAYAIEMRAAVKNGSKAEEAIVNTPTPQTLKLFRYCDIRANGWGKAYAEKHSIKPVVASKVISCLLMVQQGRVDVSLQSTVVMERAMMANNLEHDLTILPTVFGQMTFTLLLSKKSAFGQPFLNQFDETIAEMKQNGSYEQLLKRIHISSTQ